MHKQYGHRNLLQATVVAGSGEKLETLQLTLNKGSTFHD